MVEASYSKDEEVMLGFLEKPKNSLILTSKFLPSKVGGKQAWISEQGLPEMRCEHCGYKMSFLLQLYSNLDQSNHLEFHRMLYVFNCLSEQCIGTQRAVKVFRALVHHKNPHIEFADDNQYNKVNKQTDAKLRQSGLLPADKEEEKKQEALENAACLSIKDQEIVFDEFQIDTDFEQEDVTQFYIKEAQRLKLGKSNQQTPNYEDLDEGDKSDDDATESIQEAYLSKAVTKKDNEKHVQKLLRRYQELEGGAADPNLSPEGFENGEESAKELKSLEDFIKKVNPNAHNVGEYYKLFEYVSKNNPEQVIRYCRSATIEPLWSSQRNIISRSEVPKCEKCGHSRIFEFQIMPQLFDFLKQLHFVDWSTIVVYTCSNKNCFPDFTKGNYLPEFGYIQFSEDFYNVRYGDPSQIAKEKTTKSKDAEQQPANEKEVTQEDNAEGKKKPKKNKKKKKQKAETEIDNTREVVNAQVQDQLKDLMENFSMNNQ